MPERGGDDPADRSCRLFFNVFDLCVFFDAWKKARQGLHGCRHRERACRIRTFYLLFDEVKIIFEDIPALMQKVAEENGALPVGGVGKRGAQDKGGRKGRGPRAAWTSMPPSRKPCPGCGPAGPRTFDAPA